MYIDNIMYSHRDNCVNARLLGWLATFCVSSENLAKLYIDIDSCFEFASGSYRTNDRLTIIIERFPTRDTDDTT